MYGRALYDARKCFIHQLPEKGIVLNIGGGSGEVLQLMLESKPGMQIDFVEASDKFIALAKRKLSPELLNRVNFIHGNENSIDTEKKYNAVISFFIVDLFPQHEADKFCMKIISHLNTNGVWLFADFVQPKNLFQKLLLKFMYRFFRIMANIPAHKLPDYNS
ncbi:MAG: class I SAM-dependent methyltransferase, partial [Bacteroidota bacterium]